MEAIGLMMAVQDKIAFVGLGAMGVRMARALDRAGLVVHLWNRTQRDLEDFGLAKLCPDLAEALHDARWVLAMLRDDQASRQVWLEHGGLEALMPGSVLLECSTLSPSWVEELARCAGLRNVTLLAAPVVGSLPQVESCRLVQLVGGPLEAAQAADPILQHFSASRVPLAQPADAARIKLLINSMLAVQVAASAELLVLAEAVGLEGQVLQNLLRQTPTLSASADMAMSSMLNQQYEARFPVELMVKDLAYTLHMAEVKNQSVPILATLAGLFEGCAQSGHARANMTAVIEHYKSFLSA